MDITLAVDQDTNTHLSTNDYRHTHLLWKYGSIKSEPQRRHKSDSRHIKHTYNRAFLTNTDSLAKW